MTRTKRGLNAPLFPWRHDRREQVRRANLVVVDGLCSGDALGTRPFITARIKIGRKFRKFAG
jgi:hypothetical protein